MTKSERQQQRALDEHQLLGGAAREVDAARRGEPRPRAGRSRRPATTTAWRSGNQTNSRAPRRREQAADADAEEAREQDEVREVRQQPDVRRHPADQRDFEEEDEEGREEDPRPASIRRLTSSGHFVWCEPAVDPELFSARRDSPSIAGRPCCPCSRDRRRPSSRPEPGGGEVAEAVEERDAVREFRLDFAWPAMSSRTARRSRGGGREERLVEAALALEVDPGQAAAHRRLPRRLIDHHEVHELRHAGVGRAARSLVVGDDQVDEHLDRLVLVRREELRLEGGARSSAPPACAACAAGACCASASVRVKPAASGAVASSPSSERRLMASMRVVLRT